MAEIKKDYYPYPGYDNYYQLTNVNTPYGKPKPVHTKTYTTDQVDKMIKYVLSKITESKGIVTENVTFDTLPDPSEETVGILYNIQDTFTSDDRFLDGTGIEYPAGCNVIVVSSNGDYKFDVMMGELENIPEEGIEDIINDLYKD